MLYVRTCGRKIPEGTIEGIHAVPQRCSDTPSGDGNRFRPDFPGGGTDLSGNSDTRDSERRERGSPRSGPRNGKNPAPVVGIGSNLSIFPVIGFFRIRGRRSGLSKGERESWFQQCRKRPGSGMRALQYPLESDSYEYAKERSKYINPHRPEVAANELRRHGKLRRTPNARVTSGFRWAPLTMPMK